MADSAPHISLLRQAFPGSPTFTEKDVPDQAGRVHIITGANSGIGKVIAGILYSKNATVWIAARNEEKGLAAIESLREESPSSNGRLEFLHLDLGDLTTIKKSAETFLDKEKRLDVLFNNAGVMLPAKGMRTAQDYELQLGTNNVGPFLFTKFLTPLLVKTAKTSPKDSVRVVWVSSSAAELLSPKNGIDLNNIKYEKNTGFLPQSSSQKYGISKAGNYLQSTEFARRYGADGVISISLNPGNLKSDLDRHVNIFGKAYRYLTTYPTAYGAYTELFAAISDQVTREKVATGIWVVPWGQFSTIRKDLYLASKPESEGGAGTAQKFWEWNEEQVKSYL